MDLQKIAIALNNKIQHSDWHNEASLDEFLTTEIMYKEYVESPYQCPIDKAVYAAQCSPERLQVTVSKVSARKARNELHAQLAAIKDPKERAQFVIKSLLNR